MRLLLKVYFVLLVYTGSAILCRFVVGRVVRRRNQRVAAGRRCEDDVVDDGHDSEPVRSHEEGRCDERLDGLSCLDFAAVWQHVVAGPGVEFASEARHSAEVEHQTSPPGENAHMVAMRTAIARAVKASAVMISRCISASP